MDHGTFPKIMGSKLNHRTQICHCHLDAAHTSDWREATWVKYLKHRTATLGHSVPRTALCSSQVGTSVSRPFSNWFYNVSSPVALWWSHMVCLYVGKSWNSQGRVWFVSMKWHLYIHRNLLVRGMRSYSYKMQVASGSVSQHHARNTPRYLKKKDGYLIPWLPWDPYFWNISYTCHIYLVSSMQLSAAPWFLSPRFKWEAQTLALEQRLDKPIDIDGDSKGWRSLKPYESQFPRLASIFFQLNSVWKLDHIANLIFYPQPSNHPTQANFCGFGHWHSVGPWFSYTFD